MTNIAWRWRCLLNRTRSRWPQKRCVSLYNSSHGFNEVKIKEKLSQFPGGSINLSKGDNGIAELCIHNPNRMNAFTGTMMIELEEKISDLESWQDGKGIIVYGSDNTFCSGSDLNAVKAISNPQEGMMMCMLMQNTLTRLQRLPLISVALVQGKALGGGAELCTACDFRLMTEESEIRFVHKYMGLVPGWGGAARLIHIIGSKNALKLLCGSLKVNSESALNIGLADDIISSSNYKPLQEAQHWIAQYTKGPAEVIRATKQVVISGRELNLEDALRREKKIFGTVWGGPANLEALAKGTKHK
ncbi:ethylmalonyl-CoA decarboxylase [Bombina bombina]|uniref:ethylmalonyl-CoA decarboxylase n=1 Tax=Bombina bombina TaxID=8345 RepID=UPI00235AC26A|nr:ethylmalonyl-CoA decarboxylase [Bombina bombina]XP_053566686.1 ethylmalonyl-CoA decarboxylase [Bombina bombina]XP_053566688.1 ethylmalonyl-CoA decarboxylase [Bombina bombina]